MKKLYLVLALFLFSGSVAITTYAASNGTSIELKDDDKKKKRKKKKKKKKGCCTAQKSSCASSSAKKSCCSKDKN